MGQVEAYVEGIRDLPVLPEIAQRIISLTDDPNPNIAKIADLIQMDPTITANILNIINSGYYALRREVTSVRQAVVLLGLKQIRNLVVTMVSVNHFVEPPGSHIKLSDFWNHSLAVATIAQSLSNRFKYAEGSNVYLAGLLHDVGKVIIQCFYPEDMSRIIEVIDSDHCSMYDAEQKVLGFSHAEIGGCLTRKWKLPQQVTESIHYHHRCHRADDHVFAAILQFSDYITKVRLYAVYGDQNVDIIFDEEPCWKILLATFTQKNLDFERLLFEMDDEIDKARELVRQARGG
ncbi:HDOD domain-containing protein [Sulfidibacter corallicola]|uniref:HDOD domain-containing protein n=1 Tax=Sulfidibacter corallicola TaxID=2818388 RepID=A0A8A4TT38_SULCO|nr:HDOD domain-containing protein [Sulfidibacter corallicola]QTD52221.1 HDOD domain-containing protein [Sulfidibacter corallicola]